MRCARIVKALVAPLRSRPHRPAAPSTCAAGGISLFCTARQGAISELPGQRPCVAVSEGGLRCQPSTGSSVSY